LGGKDEPADERAAYLRTYMAEAYASGLRFAVPLTGNEGYYIWLDSLSAGISVADVVKPITDFINEYGSEIYENTFISLDESLVTVNGFVPYNGDTIAPSYANESKVAIAYTYRDDSLKTYLHIINHNWDTVTHTMLPQDSILVTIPVRDTCYSVTIISPDFPDTVYPAFDYEDGIVSLTIPVLEYYVIIILDFSDTTKIAERIQKLPDEIVISAYPKRIQKLPDEIVISAYPNPFNSSVVITAPAGTEIEIYDLRGRVVWERSPDLDNRHQEMSPTNRTFIWQPDQSIPSGIYLVKARTEDGQQITKRIVLIK
ncbi:MAG: hypothetical protein B6D65_05115, partial [candidate division Zixibacteria bacterium 4484_93]